MDDLQEFWVNALGMRFRLVKPGFFKMGSPRSESRRFADETPHRVSLSSPFYLSLNLTTQAEWRAVTGENPSKFADAKRAPVESVSWIDCASFIEKINSDEYLLELETYLGKRWRYSFPTEAQWEYACRAGTSTAFYWGEEARERMGNFGKTSVNRVAEKERSIAQLSKTTSEVGSFPPNPWGFFDMSGNVCEWTSDFYSDYGFEDLNDPKGSPGGIEHVARGGSWRSVPENCRSAMRFNFLSTYRGDNCGLRVAIAEANSQTLN